MTECKKITAVQNRTKFFQIMDDYNSSISQDIHKNIAPCLLVVVITEPDAGQRENGDQTEISAHPRYLPITGPHAACKHHLCSASDVTHPGAALVISFPSR